MSKSNLQEFLEDAGYECREYSGRGMYGKKCLGVLIPVIGIFIHDVVWQTSKVCIGDGTEDEARNYMFDVANALGTMQLDNLGHDQIAYFPSVQFVGEDE